MNRAKRKASSSNLAIWEKLGRAEAPAAPAEKTLQKLLNQSMPRASHSQPLATLPGLNVAERD